MSNELRRWITLVEGRDADVISLSASPADVLIAKAQPLVADGKVTSWLEKRGDAVVEIESIWSEAERGQGHATRFLRALTALADELGVTLTGVPHWTAYDPDDDDPEYDRLHDLNAQKLSNEQLEAWYGRHGFERTGKYQGDDPVITRRPRTPS